MKAERPCAYFLFGTLPQNAICQSEVVVHHISWKWLPITIRICHLCPPVAEKGSRSTHIFLAGDKKAAERWRGNQPTSRSRWLGEQEGQVAQSC